MVVVMRKMKRFDWIILGLLALMFVLIIVDLIVTKDKQMVSNKAFTVLVCIVELVLDVVSIVFWIIGYYNELLSSVIVNELFEFITMYIIVVIACFVKILL